MDNMIVERLQVKGADVKKLKKALAFAKQIYNDKKRDYNDSFLEHCISVATILSELSLDETTVLSGILHDVAKIEGHTTQEVKDQFGEEVASLIDGIEDISQIRRKMKDTEVENARKLILASTKDIRVLFLRLAISLDNISKVRLLRDEERKKKTAKNVMDIYAPLAHKLGLYNIKGKMEDCAFRILMPEEYIYIEKKLRENEQERDMHIQKIKNVLEEELKKQGHQFVVAGRSKHHYSIYRKMKNKNKRFEELHDLIALRIITNNVGECYEVLGIVHQLWQPITGELDDYIANPKDNLYQSIHTTVIAEGMPVEFQIRTQQMNEIAEYGIAAHWKYKGYSIDTEFDKKINWMKQIFGAEKGALTREIKIDLFGDEIFVFTPKGKVISLQTGSTPVDFAYAIHSDIGNHCKGARVNGMLVPLKHQLKTGDIVDILTSNNHKPSREWLKFVKTSKAVSKIKNYILIEEKIPGLLMPQ